MKLKITPSTLRGHLLKRRILRSGKLEGLIAGRKGEFRNVGGGQIKDVPTGKAPYGGKLFTSKLAGHP